MTLQKTLYAIKGCAREQRALADQCVHAPKLKASSLQNAAEMDAAAAYVEALVEAARPFASPTFNQQHIGHQQAQRERLAALLG